MLHNVTHLHVESSYKNMLLLLINSLALGWDALMGITWYFTLFVKSCPPFKKIESSKAMLIKQGNQYNQMDKFHSSNRLDTRGKQPNYWKFGLGVHMA